MCGVCWPTLSHPSAAARVKGVPGVRGVYSSWRRPRQSCEGTACREGPGIDSINADTECYCSAAQKGTLNPVTSASSHAEGRKLRTVDPPNA